MPVYRAESKFGPWKRGDVFHSVDPWYETLPKTLVAVVGEEEGPGGVADVQAEEPGAEPPAPRDAAG